MKLEDYGKYYIQGSDHYLIPTDDFTELVEENKELNKQLENYKKLGFKHLQDKNNNLENQQKEFIKYLEGEIYTIEPKGTGINYNCEYDSEEDYISAMKECSKLNTLKYILQKYKEIIGDDK